MKGDKIMVKLGKIHILAKNDKTLCGKQLSKFSSSSYISMLNKSAIKNYIKGTNYHPRRCKICLNILQK